MYSIHINGEKVIKTDIKLNGREFSGTIEGRQISGDIVRVSSYQFHLLYNNTSYNADVIKISPEEKSMLVKINGYRFKLELKDKYDELLHSLGLDDLAVKKVSDIKAPMPGMVLNVLVQEGAEVKKGDALIVLEAMKMENILKSPSDGLVKKITAVKGKAVEKNEILIQF